MPRTNNKSEDSVKLEAYLNANPDEKARLWRFAQENPDEFQNHLIALPPSAVRHPWQAVRTGLFLAGAGMVLSAALIFMNNSFNPNAGMQAIKRHNAIPPNILEVWYGGRK